MSRAPWRSAGTLVRIAAAALSVGACSDASRPPPVTRVRPPATPAELPAPERPPPARTLLAAARPAYPPPGGGDACTDASLTLTLEVDAVAGSSGRIRVLDVDAPDPPADVIDLAATRFTDVIGGRAFFVPKPLVVDGRVAHVRLRSGALRPNRTYAVLVDDGVLVDREGRSLGALEDASVWRFTTRASTARSPRELTVSSDGGGDFCSVQGAFDTVPEGNSEPVTIFVKRGIYREIVFVKNKSSITLRGEDRAETVILYENNEKLQDEQGAGVRALAGFEDVTDLVIENLGFHNTTAQGGSQAEALRVDPGERVSIRRSSFVSRQDTLLLTGRIYVADSYVQGNVDYVWGKGTAFFERVELRSVGRPGWTVQARNPADRFGYVFVDSTLSVESDAAGHLLARVDATRFPGSHVAWIGCRLGPGLDPKGWEITASGRAASKVRFWEADSRDLEGRPLDLSKRHPGSKRLGRAEAAKMRDKRHVLGGWDPDAGLR